MIRFFIATMSTVCCLGCVAAQHEYHNVDRNVLWTAMVAVANAPEYSNEDFMKRWVLVENDVVTHADIGKIDVHRIVERTLHLPLQKSQHDRREIMFSVYLLPTNPPKVEFMSHNTQFLPVRSRDEAERFFSAVESMLQPVIEQVQ